ncbi:MAG: cytochrome c [Rhodospirillaceae bacterium]
MRGATRLIAALLLLGGGVRASDSPLDQDAIEYRKSVMRTLEAQFNAIAHIIAFEGPPQNLRSHLEAALITARTVLPSFQKRAPGGTSQPQIWEKWDDYTMHARQFEAAIAMAVEAAKHGDVSDVIWYTDQVSCRQCHNKYQQPRVRGRGWEEEYLGY